MPVPRVCVFDVNETLLDLSALDPHFARVFGDAGVRQLWFTQVLQSGLVSTVLNTYTDFGSIGATALTMIATRRGVQLSDHDRQDILGTMRHLPPHPDVRAGLDRLQAAGLRLATLTNSTSEVAEAQMRHAGLDHYFEQVLSADSVRRLKPAPETYRMAAERLGVDVSGMRLIATHAWDIAGAMHVGCSAAFVARRAMVLDPLFPPPDIVGDNLIDVAEQIMEREEL